MDYIRLHGLFVFDLKDIYITIPEVSFYIYVILNIRKIKAIDDKKIIKDFWQGYIKPKIKTLING